MMVPECEPRHVRYVTHLCRSLMVICSVTVICSISVMVVSATDRHLTISLSVIVSHSDRS